MGESELKEKVRNWVETEAGACVPAGKQDELATSLSRYFTLLKKWTEAINLSRIRSHEAFLRQCRDALLIAQKISLLMGDTAGKVVDIGSGAGFPGVIIKLMYPGLVLTLLEPNQKRVAFLHRVRHELRLEALDILAMRAEDAAGVPKLRSRFNIATCKALGRLSIAVSLAFPLLRPGGYLIAAKGNMSTQELEEGIAKTEKWEGKVIEIKPPIGEPACESCRLVLLRRG